MIRMGQVGRAASVSLLLMLAVWPSTGSAATAAPAPLRKILVVPVIVAGGFQTQAHSSSPCS
jgi:hypothetical protein